MGDTQLYAERGENLSGGVRLLCTERGEKFSGWQ